jgi:hypothetical protein
MPDELMSPTLSRKAFLKLAASAVPGVLWPRGAAAQAQSDADRRERVADIIRTYHWQGVHRTATQVDNESGQWLVAEASKAGAEVTPRGFSLERVDLHACFVEQGGTRREALPLFDGTFTGPDGIRGRLGTAESGAPIALVTLDGAAISTEGNAIRDLRRKPGLQAIVAITKGGLPGLCPSNAVSFAAPYGVPVLQVSSTTEEWLTPLAQSGGEIRVLAHVTRTRASADNIVATVKGRRPELPPVVVMTPRSGWWQCASERGGGIACWLEAMRAVCDVRPDRTVRFVASSGHELGHLGLDAFLHEEQPLIASAAAWLHLGANIGAAGGEMRVQASSDDLETLAVTAVERAGARFAAKVPRGRVPGGEARNIHVGGGRYVSMLGSSPHFHNPLDLWPYAVDLEAVTRYATATAELTLMLARAS